VAARLILINQPYVDHWSWRQSDAAAIARNFFEHGFRFDYPQIDWAGDATGYVGTEFPILPFIAAICYKFAGIHEWIGRSQSVVFFAVSLPFFFLLMSQIFGQTAAIWATFFYAFAPLNVFAGRSFMPDVPSLSLAIIGLYFFLRWIDSDSAASFFVAAISISLALLIKLPSAVIGVPLLFLVWQKWRWNFLRQPALWLFAVITLLPSATWYWHAYQIAERFYPHHFFGEGGIEIENFSWYWNIVGVTAIGSLTPILSIMAIIGLILSVAGSHRKYAHLFHCWLVAMILFIIVVGYGNRHPWYRLPVVPIAAAFAGAACASIKSKVSSRIVATTLSILLASAFAILAYYCVRPIYRPSAAQLRDAGLELNKITAHSALIVAADAGDPTIFYYAERKGWHFLEDGAHYAGDPSDSQQAIVHLEQLRRRGATHLVFTASTCWLQLLPGFDRHLTQVATLIQETPEFRIYKLTPAAR
jgi:4-amino-4-deoxy-L-arabinose transferase-like glycosyltransferase